MWDIKLREGLVGLWCLKPLSTIFQLHRGSHEGFWSVNATMYIHGSSLSMLCYFPTYFI
jgi:hypothetical protein